MAAASAPKPTRDAVARLMTLIAVAKSAAVRDLSTSEDCVLSDTITNALEQHKRSRACQLVRALRLGLVNVFSGSPRQGANFTERLARSNQVNRLRDWRLQAVAAKRHPHRASKADTWIACSPSQCAAYNASPSTVMRCISRRCP